MTDYTELRAALAGWLPAGRWHSPGCLEVHKEDHETIADTNHFALNEIDEDHDIERSYCDQSLADYIAAADPSTIRALLAERDALRVELDRLTTLRPMSELPDAETVIVHQTDGTQLLVTAVCLRTLWPLKVWQSTFAGWTPIPEVKP